MDEWKEVENYASGDQIKLYSTTWRVLGQIYPMFSYIFTIIEYRNNMQLK